MNRRWKMFGLITVLVLMLTVPSSANAAPRPAPTPPTLYHGEFYNPPADGKMLVMELTTWPTRDDLQAFASGRVNSLVFDVVGNPADFETLKFNAETFGIVLSACDDEVACAIRIKDSCQKAQSKTKTVTFSAATKDCSGTCDNGWFIQVVCGKLPR